MLFSSQAFVLLFLPLVLGVYYAAPGLRGRQLALVLGSLVFYGYWDVRFVPALVGLTLAVWLITQWHAATGRDWVLVFGIALNLLVLGACKYANFIGGTVASLVGAGFTPFDIILPLGVSFFTFQKMSYLVDLRRGDRHIYGLLEFFAFVTFFPQLIAGPIVRHDEMMPQWRRDPHGLERWENLSRGLVLFTIGFAKKVVLADTLARTADPLFAQAASGPLNLAEAWLAAAAFALQIYFDFSGYSDMAVGLGRMFGLRLPLNFEAPYRAISIRDLWRRWHMTLSRFLRDYVYIPLGGNRRGDLAQARNVILTMLLGGLWHGAAWTYVLWGGLQGVALAVNGGWVRRGWPMPAALGWALTFGFFVATFTVFRAADLPTAWRIWRGLAGAEGIGSARVGEGWALAVGLLAATLGPTSQAVALGRLRPVAWVAVPAGIALAGLVLMTGGRLPVEFIYFQF